MPTTSKRPAWIRVAAAGFACGLGLAGCASSAPRPLEAPKSQVELRSFQTRAFDTADREKTLRAVIATLQDLGFVMDHADVVLGSVTATRFSGPAKSQLPYRIRMTVTVRPRGQGQLLVRASGQYNLKQLDDPESYQQFFTALGKAMFLEAQQVE